MIVFAPSRTNPLREAMPSGGAAADAAAEAASASGRGGQGGGALGEHNALFPELFMSGYDLLVLRFARVADAEAAAGETAVRAETLPDDR